ncbi:MAG: PQQ-binding-like beta-propeller repeat protein [Verrucomicrobia bacterium]|nr:PQQ-binding-like beta-propeller repeat protein [Verrucomicrobiota bacterium]
MMNRRQPPFRVLYSNDTMRGLVAALGLPLLMLLAARADDWPQWRGPDRDGVWNEAGILHTFPAGGLKIRWRVPVSGGFSSPVVAQGRVYLTDSELQQPKARERIHCFAETTGEKLWTHDYDGNYPEWAFEKKNRLGPVATPIVADCKAYAMGWMGRLHCLNALNGNVLWQKDLAKEYPGREIVCNASPLLDGDRLIAFIGAKPAPGVIALDKNTGKEIWKALDAAITHSSPVIITAGGVRQLVVWTEAAVTSLDPATGRTWWSQRLLASADYVVATPVFHQGLLLISGLMLKLDPGKPAMSVLWPQTRAVSRRVLSNTSTPLFRGDHLYSARSSGELVCIEARTGKQVWTTDKATGLTKGASIHLTPNGDSVLLFTDRGDLIRARLTPQGYKELSRVHLIEPTFLFGGHKAVWAPPAYANQHVFARNDKELVCASLAAEP